MKKRTGSYSLSLHPRSRWVIYIDSPRRVMLLMLVISITHPEGSRWVGKDPHQQSARLGMSNEDDASSWSIRPGLRFQGELLNMKHIYRGKQVNVRGKQLNVRGKQLNVPNFQICTFPNTHYWLVVRCIQIFSPFSRISCITYVIYCSYTIMFELIKYNFFSGI